MDLLLFLIPIILVFGAQGMVNSSYNKYKLYKIKSGITGSDAARQILSANKLDNVKVIETTGVLTDHFDPRNNVIRLSKEIYNGNSVAAVAVAAHEVGHAIQYDKKYLPIRIRSLFVPVVNVSSRIGFIMIFIGIFSELFNIALIGLILMSAGLLFQLVTLPVEFNASKRAKNVLLKEKIIEKNELSRVNGMLNAAAMTYLASFFATLIQMLRLFLIVRGGRRR